MPQRENNRRREIIEELHRRHNVLVNSLFPKQRAAVEDTNSKKCYLTTRRAGKTTASITDILACARKYPNTAYAFICITQPQAEGIAWPILKGLDRRFDLNIHFLEAKLKAILPNGSWIRLYGADKPNWMSRLYGHKFMKVIVDEASYYRIPLQPLIEDVLEPTVTDLNGQIVLTGTPGYITKGIFYQATTKGIPGWTVHKWNTFDNPYMDRQFREKMTELQAANPDVVNQAWFRRNYLGEWVTEFGERVYKFDDAINHLDAWERHPEDHYILGVDLGWCDSTAFSVVCWNKTKPYVVELESFKESEMRLDTVGRMVQNYMDIYKPLQVVADPSHRQVFEELRRRFRLPIMEAEKYGKIDYIEITNSDMQAGKIKLLNSQVSPHVEEMSDLVWRTFPSGKRVEQPGLPNDACDAFLYAFRHARHYLYEKPVDKPSEGSQEWHHERARNWKEEMIRQEEARLTQQPTWY